MTYNEFLAYLKQTPELLSLLYDLGLLPEQVEEKSVDYYHMMNIAIHMRRLETRIRTELQQ